MDFNQWFQEFLQRSLDFIPHLIFGLIIFGLSLYLAVPAARWAGRVAKKRLEDASLVDVIMKITRWAVIITGTIVALEQVNFNVTGFVAGLGIAGLTIGFALQDITRNFIAGLILMTRKPFKVGDTVLISGYTGKVVNINTRDTILRTFDGEVVIMPNMNVFSTAITNQSDLPDSRRTVRIRVEYNEDITIASQKILQAIKEVEGVLADPSASVMAEELGNNEITLVARFWLNQTTHNPLEVHSNVVRAIKETVEREHINIPHPVQMVRLTDG